MLMVAAVIHWTTTCCDRQTDGQTGRTCNVARNIAYCDSHIILQCCSCVLQDCGVVLCSDVDGRGCYPLDDHVL